MIVPHDASRLHYIGVQSAVYRISGNGSDNFFVPLAGPKRIRAFKFVTDDNTGVVSLSVTPQDDAGGADLCAAQDLFQPMNTTVTVNESAIDADVANIGAAFDGLAFSVVAGGAGAWGFHVQVLYSAILDANATVCLDPQVSGLQ